jgi:hypothetical protein
MKTKLACVCLLTGLTLAAAAGRARAQAAPRLTGVWSGSFSDGGSFSLVINPDRSGGFAVRGPTGRVLRGAAGRWSFLPNATGGALTLTYFHAGVARVGYGITYVNASTIVLTDYFTAIGPVRVVLRRLS